MNIGIVCPEKCDQCDVCKGLAELFEDLQDAYFLLPTNKIINQLLKKNYEIKDLILNIQNWFRIGS